MVFECLDGAFRGVDAVVRRLDELPPAVFVLEEFFDGPACLVVGDVEGGPMALVLSSVKTFSNASMMVLSFKFAMGIAKM